MLSKAQISKIIELIGNDGHTIYDANNISETSGIPMDELAPYIRDHVSDGSPKGSITRNDGKFAEHIVGIYGLDMLRKLARENNIPYPSAMGRGFKARNITEAIASWLSN